MKLSNLIIASKIRVLKNWIRTYNEANKNYKKRYRKELEKNEKSLKNLEIKRGL